MTLITYKHIRARPRECVVVSARTDFYRVRGVNADAGGRPDGNFHPKTSVMTSLVVCASELYI
jgi:hypothetical protein